MIVSVVIVVVGSQGPKKIENDKNVKKASKQEGATKKKNREKGR